MGQVNTLPSKIAAIEQLVYGKIEELLPGKKGDSQEKSGSYTTLHSRLCNLELSSGGIDGG